MTSILAVLSLVAVLAISTVIEGFVIQQLWEWLIVPVFDTISLTLPQAMGLGLLIAFLKRGLQREESDADSVAETLVQAWIVYPLVTLVFGFIIHLLIQGG